ncbi:DUF4328 domain-containing protein [Aquipuribacter sp. MA13-6]|uniref:DUF4328 domain-containing protein n=1 Tax=unclassified Aquipuribacter TaxID=2635084 RepID=UPI003EEBA1C1
MSDQQWTPPGVPPAPAPGAAPWPRPAPSDPYAPPAGDALPPGHSPAPGYPQAPGYANAPGYAQAWAAPAPSFRPVTTLGRAVVGVGAVWLLLALVGAFLSVPASDAFAQTALTGGAQPFLAYDGVVLLAVVAQLVALVLTALWLTAVRRNVEQVAPGSQRRGAVWTWLGWLVPVVSLWFPYQVVADAGRASTRRALAYGGWWAAFLVALGLQNVAGQLIGGFTGVVDADLVQALPVVEALGVAALATAFVLWARIVLTVSAVHARWSEAQAPVPG